MTCCANAPDKVRMVTEVPEGSNPTRWVHPEWRTRLPWLVQGTTGRGSGSAGGDFALFGVGVPPPSPHSWIDLAHSLGFSGMVHSRQIHGSSVTHHPGGVRGLALGPDADGHATGAPGVLMGITVADCVPVFLVDPVQRAAALLHAGWRGTVEGILEEGIGLMRARLGSDPSHLLLHLGPAICGDCYEVGPEVHEALGLPRPGGPQPVDLRIQQALRAREHGIPAEHITLSSLCTRCSAPSFFSHRGGDAGRQVGFLGIRPEGTGLCQGCRWVREVRNRRGSRFLLCRRWETHRSFPRYPAQPVLSCSGFEAGSPPEDAMSLDLPPAS